MDPDKTVTKATTIKFGQFQESKSLICLGTSVVTVPSLGKVAYLVKCTTFLNMSAFLEIANLSAYYCLTFRFGTGSGSETFC
jgi:hypothetical protein